MLYIFPFTIQSNPIQWVLSGAGEPLFPHLDDHTFRFILVDFQFQLKQFTERALRKRQKHNEIVYNINCCYSTIVCLVYQWINEWSKINNNYGHRRQHSAKWWRLLWWCILLRDRLPTTEFPRYLRCTTMYHIYRGPRRSLTGLLTPKWYRHPKYWFELYFGRSTGSQLQNNTIRFISFTLHSTPKRIRQDSHIHSLNIISNGPFCQSDFDTKLRDESL